MSEFDGMTQDESINHQTKRWAEGTPLHNTVRDECCPDFSCCNGGKMMPIEARARLLEARIGGDNETVQRICMMGLSGLVANSDVNVHIIDEDDTSELH